MGVDGASEVSEELEERDAGCKVVAKVMGAVEAEIVREVKVGGAGVDRPLQAMKER